MVTTYKQRVKDDSISTDSLQNRYRTMAQKRNIGNVRNRNSEWILANGQGYTPLRSKETETIPEADASYIQKVGQYCSNNGMLSFVDENGNTYVAPLTKQRVEELKKAGYTKGDLPVPFSNGELPSDPKTRKLFLEMKERAGRINEKNQMQDFEKECQAAAKDLGISEVSGDWMPTDDVPYTSAFSSDVDPSKEFYRGKVLPKSREFRTSGVLPKEGRTPGMTGRRIEHVGKYNINNDMIAFTDEHGKTYAGTNTPDRRQALKLAGYKLAKDMHVPLSNGEIPAEGDYAAHLLKMRGEKDDSADFGMRKTIPTRRLNSLLKKGLTQEEALQALAKQGFFGK